MPILKNVEKLQIKKMKKSLGREHSTTRRKSTKLLYPTNFFCMNFGNFPPDSLLNSSFFMPVFNFLGNLWPDRSSTVCSFEAKGPMRREKLFKKVNQNKQIFHSGFG
jgi:hypothetical protein